MQERLIFFTDYARRARLLLRSQTLRLALVLSIVVVPAIFLIATIFWPQYNTRWPEFFGGLLFAAALALACQMLKIEWLMMRRTKQLNRVKDKLRTELSRNHAEAIAIKNLESRIQLLSNALPTGILYLDHDERCRFHNSAAEKLFGTKNGELKGQLLRDITGSAAYKRIGPHIAGTFTGTQANYEMATEHGNRLYSICHIPYSPADDQPIGFYFLATEIARITPAVAGSAKPQPYDSINFSPESTIDGDALYTQLISTDSVGWSSPEAEFTSALENNEFLLFAQKILPLKGGDTNHSSYEILIRLNEEEKHLVPPGSFLPIAERYGLMEKLDTWVVNRLIDWCHDKQEQNASWTCPLFYINLSEAALTSPKFSRNVINKIRQTNVNMRSICFEIAAHDIIRRKQEVSQLITVLAPMGCRFAVDDFGDNKSPFSCIKGLKFDFVKIDGAMVQRLATDRTARARASSINKVCKILGIRTVAKLIENKDVLDAVRELEFDYAQGYGISRPDRIDAVARI